MSTATPHLTSAAAAKRPLPAQAQAQAHARPQSQPQAHPTGGQFKSPEALGAGTSPGLRAREETVGGGKTLSGNSNLSGSGSGLAGLGHGFVTGVGQGLTPGLGHGLMLGLGQGLTPGLGQGLTPGLGQGLTLGLGQGLTPGLGQGLTPGLGQGLTPGLGQGLTPGLGQGLTPGLGQSFAGWSSPAIGAATSFGSTAGQVLVGFDSPAMLGGLGLTALEGGVGMGISMSNMGNLGLGLSASGMGKVDDGERRRRLEAVLATVGERHGRVSQEGLERLSRRFGLEVMWDEGMRDGRRTLSMAGSTMVVDVNFDRSSAVDHVALQFANTADPMTDHAESAAEVLREDLKTPPGVSTINATLDKFANNLERLARMDKLSTPGSNCFEAVFGVYTGLKRLYDHEKKAAEELLVRGSDDIQEKSERHVMCKANGRPRLHAHRRVGLSLDFWTDQHLVPKGRAMATATGDDTQMDVDSPYAYEYGEVDQIYFMVIECEPSPPALYPPVRISNDWLSEQIEKPPDDLHGVMVGHDPTRKLVLNWLDPPSVNTLDANGRIQIDQPHARFVAKLEPPIILPLSTTMQLYASVGINIGQEPAQLTSLDSLILPHAGPAVVLGEPREIRVERHILASDHNASDTIQKWNLGLFLSRTELARKVEHVPFVHPRQLVALLPILRQYAFITRLLRNSFKPLSPSQTPYEAASTLIKEPVNGKQKTLESELAALLGPSALSAPPRALDVAFSTMPSPNVTLVFPTPDGVKKVTFNILLDAEVVVAQQDLVVVEKSEEDAGAALFGNGNGRRQKSIGALAEALMVCEDLGVWAEWVRKRYF